MFGLLVAACASCKTVYPARFAHTDEPGRVDTGAPFLKCHMFDGRLYVLKNWEIDVPAHTVTGDGLLYDADRNRVGSPRKLAVAMDNVALFETNRVEQVSLVSDGAAQLAIMGVASAASAALTVFCVVNPKACFGSCPTFFASDGQHDVLQAEGFSGSFARSLEETDVDAMWTARAAPGPYEVTMTNDALETHAVDSVRLITLPRPAGGRVLRSGSRYFEASKIVAPTVARSPEGDVTSALSSTDGREVHSLASPTDLGEHETIELTFPDPGGPAGVVIVARNSLLGTFLFYQELAFMGRKAGEYIASLERLGKDALLGAAGLLPTIEVLVRDDTGAWVHAGDHAETGPIANEAQLVVLPDRQSGPVHVRLSLIKGGWRIDQVGLASLGREVQPSYLAPEVVTHLGSPDAHALDALRPGGAHLITQPGDAYRLRFELPAGDQELFLEARGYYYEWMRESWLLEEDQEAATRMLLQPGRALKELAPKFKAMEPEMDRIFWESKYAGGKR